MHNMQIKMKFIQLKAEGIPMYKIAHALGVHRTTLTLWHKELADFILIARQDYMDELLYENNNTKLHRIETISRHLKILYKMLDEPEEMGKAGMEYPQVLDLIAKYTKILHLEANEKYMERLIKNQKEKTNPVSGSEKEKSSIYVTDMESFRMHQPELINNEEGNVDEFPAEEIIELEKEDGHNELSMYLDTEISRDFADEEPEMQEVFKRTLRQRAKAGRDEESVKNPSQEENLLKENLLKKNLSEENKIDDETA